MNQSKSKTRKKRRKAKAPPIAAGVLNPRQSRTAPPVEELLASVSREVGRAVTTAFEQVLVLESIASQALSLVGEIRRDASAAELQHRAHNLFGLALHGGAVLTQLQVATGRLNALAAVREADETPSQESSRR